MALDCCYGKCLLPKNNNRYLWQFAYICIGLCSLFVSTTEFNFFQTFLFISPVFVDVISTDINENAPTLKRIRKIFGALNAIVLVFCMLGWRGVILDEGNYFSVVSTFVLFSNMSIKKRTLGLIIAFNIVVPIVFWIGSPCQSSQKVLEQKRSLSDNEKLSQKSSEQKRSLSNNKQRKRKKVKHK